MDEKPYQLLSHAREPLLMESGKPAREDFEYARNGTCSIFNLHIRRAVFRLAAGVGAPAPNPNRPGASHPTAA